MAEAVIMLDDADNMISLNLGSVTCCCRYAETSLADLLNRLFGTVHYCGRGRYDDTTNGVRAYPSVSIFKL